MSEAETRHEGGDAVAYRKGAWSKEEDEKLKRAVEELGDKNWVRIERFSGLARPAKNCRLRWLNYLRPNLKKYPFTKEEEDFIFLLHAQYGNAWSRIASKLPGRSDNEIKNFWHKKAKKRQREELLICPTPKHKKQNHTLSQLTPPQSQSTLLPNTPNLLFSEASPQPPTHSSLEPTSSAHQPFLSPHQMHCSSVPLQLKLPPGLVAPPPFSPLNLRLSMPAPSESSLPIQHPANSSSLTFPSCIVEESLLPTQPITALQEQLPSIQFNPLQTLGVNSYMHQVESNSDLEMINELRKAQAQVRFLKKKLRQRGISNKRNLLKQSSRNKHLFITSPEEGELLTTQVPLDENSSRMKEIIENNSRRKSMVRRKNGIEEKAESGECVQESIDSEMPIHGENSYSKASVKKGFERKEEVSVDEIFKMKYSETFPEQRHHNHQVNSQYNVIAPNWNLWDECSSTLLQELEGDLLGERSQIDEPFSPKRGGDALSAVYSQSSATTLERPGDESSQVSYGAEYFKCSLGQEFSDGLHISYPDSNLGAESLHVHQNTAVDLVECSNLVSQPMAVHESLGPHDFSLLAFGERSAPTQLCQSSLIQHQYHEAQQCSLNEFYGGITERTSREEPWKQESMEGLVADDLWVEDEKFFLDSYESYDFTC